MRMVPQKSQYSVSCPMALLDFVFLCHCLLHFYICIDLLDNFDYFNILGDKNLNYSII